MLRNAGGGQQETEVMARRTRGDRKNASRVVDEKDVDMADEA